MGRPKAFPGMKPSKGGAYSAKSVIPKRVATDPVVADDAPCIVCGRERPKVPKLHGDPFCRRECCESYYDAKGVAA